jgi:hypothetical protein
MSRGSAFWRWRHARPFWGGLFVFLGGTEIFLTVKAPLPVIVHVGMQGFIGYLLPIIIGLLGLLLIFNPAQRLFYSLLAAVLALASWITSNLGGFVVGLLLALVGSALAFAWSPTKLSAAAATAQAAPDESGRADDVPQAPQASGDAGPEEMPEAQPPTPERETVDLTLNRDDDRTPNRDDGQVSGAPPGVQPDTSHSRPRHRRTSSGLLSGE